MEKEALIDIILNDLKEVHTLVKTFKGKNEINTAFVNLTRTKIANINEELSLLEQLNGQKTTAESAQKPVTNELTNTSSPKDFEPTVSPKPDFHKEETKQNDEVREMPRAVEEKKEPVIKENKPNDTHTSTTKAHSTPTNVKIEKKGQVVAQAAKATTQPMSSAEKDDTIGTQASVLGETIKPDAASVNEVIANSKDSKANFKQIGKPVSDVKKAIGLNDRFYFQRELFDNNADLFNQTLDQINQMDSFNEAVSFLQSNFNWDENNAVTESFIKSIQRRFL